MTSHIHIEGDYAIREGQERLWVLHAMPRVRIGPASRPFTLASPVKYPLEPEPEDKRADQIGGNGEVRSKAQQQVAGRICTLSAEQYDHLVERVYSSVATQVYQQIKADVRDKVRMFPSSYLRAVALFHEAEDFEKSNTVDAYDQALNLYRESKAYFQIDIRQRLVQWLADYNVWISWPPWQRRRLIAAARLCLGYSRCLIYRRTLSTLSGRAQNPVFEIRGELARAREYIKQCYNRALADRSLRLPTARVSVGDPAGGGEVAPKTQSYRARMARLTFPDNSPLPLRRRRQELYNELRELLCEAYAVSALGYSQLNDVQKATHFLDEGRALTPTSDHNQAFIHLAEAEIQPSLLPKLPSLQSAVEIAPDLEVARYNLARYLDMRARDLNEINPQRIEDLTRYYAEVLKINPGNIGALVSQGYLCWLVGDRDKANLDKAKKKLKTGEELQAMVSQTFVGDIKYGLARVVAEQAALSFELAIEANKDESRELMVNATELLYEAYYFYRGAVAANPAVAIYGTQNSEILHSYYDFIHHSMLERFRIFQSRVCGACHDATAWEGELDITILQYVRSCALNDYGNACLNYFFRTGSHQLLDTAIRKFEEAVCATERNLAAAYNLCIAYQWRGREGDGQKAEKSIRKVPERSPHWQEAVILQAQARLDLSRQKITDKQNEIDNLRGQKEQEEKKLQQQQLAASASRASDRQDATVVAEDRDPETDQSIEAIALRIGQAEREGNELKKQLPKEAKLALDQIIENTGLKPLVGVIDADGNGVDELLGNKDIKWERLGEDDVRALRAWAEVLATRAEVLADQAGDEVPANSAGKGVGPALACEKLCQHLLETYWPEDFTLNWLLLRALDAQSSDDLKARKACDDAIAFTVNRWQKIDPSWIADYQVQNLRAYRAKVPYQQGNKLFEEKSYTAAAEKYWDAIKAFRGDVANGENKAVAANGKNKAVNAFPVGPMSHYDLAQALEKDISQGSADKQEEEIVSALETAHKLAPNVEEYGQKLLRAKRRKRLAERWGRKATERLPLVNTLTLEIAADLVPYVTTSEDNRSLNEALGQLIEDTRRSIKRDLGIILPGVTFRDNQVFHAGTYILLLREVPLDGAKLDPTLRFCPKPLSEVSKFAAAAHAALNPEAHRVGVLVPQEGSFVPQAESEKLNAAGLPVWEVMEYAVKHLGMIARLNAAELLGTQEVMSLLKDKERAGKVGGERSDASRLRQFRESPAKLGALGNVLRGLLIEGVPIVDLEDILQVFDGAGEDNGNLVGTVEAIRSLPKFRPKLPGNRPDDSSTVFPLAANFENEISDGINRTYSERFLEPTRVATLQQHLLEGIRRTLGVPPTTDCTLLVSRGELRPFVRTLIQSFYPTIPVLSLSEILPARAEKIGPEITL